MRIGDRSRWVLAFSAGVLLLLAPALWNGFALINYDTGGYLARWYEGTLEPNRAVPYGLLLSASVPFMFIPVLALQSALSVWLISLSLRAHGLGGRAGVLLGVVGALAAFTTLPWLTSLLLTDIFCGLGVLALYLLLMLGARHSAIERAGLIAVVAFSAATHNATLMVLFLLLAAAAVLALVTPTRLPVAGFGRGALALVLGIGIVFAADAVVAKRLAWTPGGLSFPFGRLLQDGLVQRYLDDHCPDANLRLCPYKDELPRDGDRWFWDSDLFNRLGRFAGLGEEMRHIGLDALVEYPAAYVQGTFIATARQLVILRTGEGVVNSTWHSYSIIERFTPQLAPAMREARQQRGELDFAAINRLHVPAGLAALGLLPVLVLLAWRGRIPRPLGEMAAMAALAVLANAAVCGALSNPHDRYGARMVWIAALVGAIAVARLTVRLWERVPAENRLPPLGIMR